MNDLADQFGDNLVILAFPANQHGHQNQNSDDEMLNMLKYVRPGNGYEPKFPILTKCEVNGANEAPVFTFLKEALPSVSDDKGGLGSDHMTDMTVGQPLLWAPLRRGDITWNFEKFLINQEGVPVKRYSPKFLTSDIGPDIAKLVSDGPNAL
mmetsp:Transcript_26084/g.85718  ORF Transcript_26084/g.85718 Transcript_26084/m.85718 type:complete len:152 (+) Transcript_26084:263-718(+)